MADVFNAKEKNWDVTANRFVAFFDILGFKDFVLKHPHEFVLDKITLLKNARRYAVDGFATDGKKVMNTNLKSFQFSDSFFVFTATDSAEDFLNLLFLSRVLLSSSYSQKIPLKGAISYGKITADFENSIFVGQPIIDAYVLHEDLYMLGAILDHNVEKKIKEFQTLPLVKNVIDYEFNEQLSNEIVRYKTPSKSGQVNYYCLKWPLIVSPDTLNRGEFLLHTFTRFQFENFYTTVSGKARIYIDNTLDFIDYLIEKAKKEHPKIKEFRVPYQFHPTGE